MFAGALATMRNSTIRLPGAAPKAATQAYAIVRRRADDEVDTVSVIKRTRISYSALRFRKERNYSYDPGIEMS
jgi:hypothetical protein